MIATVIVIMNDIDGEKLLCWALRNSEWGRSRRPARCLSL